MAGRLRRAETVIDEETERAVASWVRLGDHVAGQHADDDATCARCGSSVRILGRREQTLCARCYLERGDTRT